MSLREKLSPYKEPHTDELDLFSEQHDVRQSVKHNLYTGRTYNSVENISQFFAERGMPPPSGFTRRPEARSPQSAQASNNSSPASTAASPPARPVSPSAPLRMIPQLRGSGGQTGFAAGATIQHPKYGRGTVLRREGEGEDAKLTISFPGYGLKKIVEKYAGFKVEE